METTTLGPFTVSRLCLGTMLMGAATPVDESHRILDRFTDAGGNFVDTADVYSDGGSEETLAPWLARRRGDVVLATKLRFAVSDPGGEGLAPDRVAKACDASLRRLGVDEIDLYQVHAPDPDVPLEDTLHALDALVRAGKVRALGASNFPAYLLAWAVALQDRNGWEPFISFQPQYSLVERSIELELLPFCRAAGLGVIPWGPLGAGFLSGKYKRGERRGARRDDPADRARLAARRRGSHGADRRPAHAGAARGRARRRRARADGRGARATRGARRPAGGLPAPHAARAERHPRCGGPPPGPPSCPAPGGDSAPHAGKPRNFQSSLSIKRGGWETSP